MGDLPPLKHMSLEKDRLLWECEGVLRSLLLRDGLGLSEESFRELEDLRKKIWEVVKLSLTTMNQSGKGKWR